MTEQGSSSNGPTQSHTPDDPERSLIVDFWHVPDGYQDEFMGQLTTAFERLAAFDGFVDGQILRGVNPSLFVSYATMRSASDRDAAMADPVFGEAARRLGGIARPRPHAYTVVRTFAPQGARA